MTVFDQLFFNSFNYYKKGKFRRNANRIAIWYVTSVQLTLLLVLGVFFAEFFTQMHIVSMSASQAWTLFLILAIIIYFKNWMQYSGKKRKIINAKSAKKMDYGIMTLWAIPLVCFFFALLLLKVF